MLNTTPAQGIYRASRMRAPLWPQQRDEALLAGIARGWSYAKIAMRLGGGITANAVASRFRKLNLKTPSDPRAQRKRKLRWLIKRTEKKLKEWKEELADLNNETPS